MFERLLLGILRLGLPDQSQTEDDAVPTQKAIYIPAIGVPEIITRFQNAAKLHVGMLSVSLIICLAFGGYMTYRCWMKNDNFMGYIRNLVIAFVCRIFFSILFDGVIVLGSDLTKVGGSNALLALECLSQSFVIAFWLLLTVYLHARMQRHFNSEPTLTVYEYGLPGVAVFFALVWIFGMQSEFPSIPWWLVPLYVPQWIASSLRLLYLLAQLGYMVDMGRMMMKTSLDNDSVSLLRKSSAVLAVLVLLFWLQFGFSLGRFPPLNSQSYQYFDAFMDGSLGGFVCLLLFFFELWVPMFLNRIPSIMAESEEAPKRSQEILLSEGRGVDTIDKAFRTKDNGRWGTFSGPDDGAECRDVMYSTVIEPHRLKKTLDLYKRLNVLPSSQATVLDGEKFYDCQTRRSMRSETGDSEKADFHSVISDDSRCVTRENSRTKTPKLSEQVPKKNAFYASKYLILDSKANDVPKFLETRPSIGKKSTREEESERDFFSRLDTMIPDELVNKWLNDNSMDLRRPEELGQANAKVSNEDMAQQSNTTSNQKVDSTVRTLESANSTIAAKALITMETETPHQAILQNKRKLSETDKSDFPNGSLMTISKQVQEATDSLGKKEPPEAQRQYKRIKSAQDLGEYWPKPLPRRQWNKPTPLGRKEATPDEKAQNAVGSTSPASHPYTESPPEAQVAFSDVIYSTFNSLLGLGDGLFKPRSSISELNKIHENKSAIFEGKMAEAPKSAESYIPADAQTLNTDEPFIKQPKIEKTEIENLHKPIFEEQSSKILARKEVEEQEKPGTGQMQKPQERNLQATVSPKAETIADDSSSESTFSIERMDSHNSSFSIDNYYAGLMANRAKFADINPSRKI